MAFIYSRSVSVTSDDLELTSDDPDDPGTIPGHFFLTQIESVDPPDDDFTVQIRRHQVRWDESPFLLCRTVTPTFLRRPGRRCNCSECYTNRRRMDRFMLSHPLGAFVDPPAPAKHFAYELRELDRVRCFSEDDSRIVLSMMSTDPDIQFMEPHWGSEYISTWTDDQLLGHVLYLRDFYPFTCAVSLSGTMYDRLKTYDPDRKGPQSLVRALRSHSFPTHSFGHNSLYAIREKYDRRYDRLPKSDLKTPRFRRIPFWSMRGTVENLIVYRCFHRSYWCKPIFSGLIKNSSSSSSISSSMAPPVKKRRNALDALVSSLRFAKIIMTHNL